MQGNRLQVGAGDGEHLSRADVYRNLGYFLEITFKIELNVVLVVINALSWTMSLHEYQENVLQ